MTAGLEAIAVQEWIWSTLSTDTELADLADGPEDLADRIWESEYQGSRPKDVDGFWWIVFDAQDTVDVKGVGAIQIMGRVRFQVKVVVRGEDYGPGIPVYQRVHQLMEARLNQVTTSGLVMTTERLSGFQFPERTTGMEYRHLGGTFEALSQ